MATELPEDVAEKLAALGEPTAEFAVTGRRMALLLVVAPLAFALGLALLVLPLVPLFFGKQPHVHAHLFVAAAFLMVAPLVSLARVWRSRGLRILIYPEGMIRLRGDEATAIFWHQVSAVWQIKNQGHWAKAVNGSLAFTIRRTDGKEIHFSDQITNLKELGKIIQRETKPGLLRRAQETMQAAGVVHFGKVRVSWEGLTCEKQYAPWSQLKEIKIEGDKLAIRREGKWLTWCAVPISEVPNVHVFMALAEQFLGVQASSS